MLVHERGKSMNIGTAKNLMETVNAAGQEWRAMTITRLDLASAHSGGFPAGVADYGVTEKAPFVLLIEKPAPRKRGKPTEGDTIPVSRYIYSPKDWAALVKDEKAAAAQAERERVKAERAAERAKAKAQAAKARSKSRGRGKTAGKRREAVKRVNNANGHLTDMPTAGGTADRSLLTGMPSYDPDQEATEAPDGAVAAPETEPSVV